jgi:hypothetical protein
MIKKSHNIETFQIPIQNVVGYSGDEDIDRIAKEMRRTIDFQAIDQAILDRHYNAKYYQSPKTEDEI